MTDKTFLLKLNNDAICPCCGYYKNEGGFVCLVEDANDKNGEYYCDGLLNKRPEWCPMREITDSGELKE